MPVCSTANEPVQGEWKSETPLQSFISRFSATPLIGIAPLTVQFTDQSVGNMTGWAWDFNNDGTIDSTEQNPVYTYNDSRVYTVKLTITGPEGTNEKVKTNYITADNLAPVVTANPPGKVYKAAQSVTLNASDNIDSLPVVYYTTDGTDPTTTSPTYTGPISITNTTTLKFMAVDDAGNQAPIQTENYTIDKAVPIVTASPDGGLYDHELDVVLSATDDVDTDPIIYYTTDGSIPTTNSTLYTAPVHITDKTILKFIAVDDVDNKAAVQTRVYYLDTVPLTSYSFVKEHTISGSVDGPLTGYQIKMNIHRGTGTDNGADVYLNDNSLNWPNDIRFTDSASNILSYWVEQSDDNTAGVWVKVNSIPTSGTTIKLYYGNANSTNMSDGSNTFVAFEDFTDDTRRTSAWTENYGGASSYVSVHTFEKRGYHIQQSSSSSRGAGIVLTSPLNAPTVCTVTLSDVSEASSYAPPRIVTKIGYGSSEYLFGCWSGQVQGGYDTLPGHVYQIRWTDGSTANNVQLYENGNLLVTGNGDFSSGQHKPGLAVRTSSSMGEWYYKNFFARVYTANEPVQGEWEGETPLQSFISRFSATPLIGVAPLTVQFTDQSAGNITGWAWDFNNDGTIDSTEQNPVYTYNDSGVYTVKLTITGPEGTNERIKTNYITADNLAPVVTANPPGKVYKAAQSVTLNASDNIDSLPVVYYTTDGTDPTTTSPTYTGPISITNTTTLKFMAVDDAGNQAVIQTENYTIDNVAPAVTTSPDGGLYDHELDVVLSATDDVDTDPIIYYTTDGSIPTTNSTLYTASVHITDKTILKFIAVDDAGNQAAVKTRVYYVETVPLKSYLLVKEHTISGSLDGPLTDYQIKMNIHRGVGTDNGSDVYLDDYSLNWPNDIRFADANNNILSYWTERSDDNTTVVWVKVNNIPTSGTTIKLFYGNANSTDMSDGTNTFVAFEDFTDDTRRTSVWTENQDSGVSGYTNVHVFENGGYHIKQSSGSDRGAEIVMTNELSVPVWCGVTFEVVSESGRTPPWIFTGVGYAASDWNLGYWGGVQGGYDTLPGHAYKLFWTNGQTTNNRLLYENNKLLFSGNGSFSTTNKPDMGVRTASQEMGEWYFRNFYARMYTANEPVQGEWSSEIHNLAAPPIASFTAASTYGFPHTIQFTDKSSNFPTGWTWDFGDGSTSTEQNPVHTYAADGNYTITLTAINEYGNDIVTKSDYEVVTLFAASITVSPTSVQLNQSETKHFTAVAVDQMGNLITNSSFNWSSSNETVGTIDANGLFTALAPGTTRITVSSEGINASAEVTVLGLTQDLMVSSVSSTTSPVSYNTITATIKNQGTGNVGLTTVNFMVGGNSTSINLTGLASGNTSIVSVTDMVHRKFGDIIPIKVTVDPENAIAEANETNNEYSMNATISSTGNYYTGGRFYSGKDLETGAYQEGNIALKYSQGDSGYQSGGGWYSTTVHWTSTDLPIPSNTTIKEARLYQSYTWCNNGNPDFTLRFNGNTVDQAAFYADPAISGGDIIGFNGQAVYNVTSYFNSSGNTALITASKPNGGLYGAVLVVIYEDASEPYRMIWLDEGCDTLYGGSSDVHVAYSMFNNITLENLVSAQVTIVLPSGGDNSLGTVIFNGQTAPIKGSGGGDPGYKWYDVTSALQSGTNEFGVRCDGGYMNLASAILEVTKETASEANFTANTTSGDAPLAVKFTDTSTGTPTNRTWDFGDGGTSIEQNPTHTYTTEGTYTVKLMVSNSLGNDSEEKTGYITVGSVVLAPVANFSSNMTSGEVPLSVQFTDESTNTPTSWAWDFGDGSTSNEQNPPHTYETAGNYTVKLTATNYGGSNVTTKTDYITVTSTESAPVANFTTDANSGQVPFTVHFTDTSAGSVSSWKWNFGDGSTSTEENPIHTYVIAGSYSVNLTATGPGGSNTSMLPVTVSAPLTANSYNGGIPLTTVQKGIVSGGLWYDSYSAMETSAQKTFTLPAYTNIKWARLYVDVYDGHMQSNYRGNVTIGIDANGDSTYELQKQETFNTAYSFPGEGGTGPVWVNDHMNRVTSDYLMWYDLTDEIEGQQVNVLAASAKVDSNFDGRVKAMTLVVAYDDGDSDQVKYWVNEGHDTVNPLDTEYTGSTSFSTSLLTSGWSSANLTAIYLASVDGTYAFNGTALASGVKSGPYYGSNTWDISSLLTIGQDSAIAYNKQGSDDYFKIPLVLMNVRYPSATPAVPVANFTATPTYGDAPLTVNFTDASTGNVSSYAWDFNNDGIVDSTDQSPSHTYNTVGNYTVNLTITGTGGSDSEVKTEYITVNEPLPGAPVANFTANVTSGTAPLTVQFTDNSTGSPTSWQWDFNNDEVVDNTEQAPIYTYATVGNYTVNLTVGNAGRIDSEVKTEYIVVNAPQPGAPVADFTATPTWGNSPLKVQFTDASTGTVSSYSWDFNNDGNVDSTEQSPLYTYAAAGNYTVNLTVTGPGGSDSEVKTGYIVVSSSTPTKPIAAFSASSTLGIMPFNVQFTDQSTGVPASWSWNFGDGGTSNESSPSHTYSKVGKFTVSLTVKNVKGTSTTRKTSYIDVEVVPVAEFSANKTLGKAPLSVKFTDKSTGDPTSWYWDFGDGSTSTEEKPVHVYSAVGRYNVTLTATNAVGNNTITKSSYIDVEGVPVSYFSASSTLGIMPLNVSFTDLSTGVPTSWSWNFGDGNTSTEQNPSHVYSKVGKFTVSLTAKNAVGSNTSRKTKYIDVEVVPVAEFSANKTLGKTPLSVKFTDKSTGDPTSLNWDFGDGTTSTEEKPVHVYSAVGIYNVTLTATNAVGNNTTVKSEYIDVEGVPVANFSANSTVGAVPFNVSFTDLSTGVPTSWSWSFGDGNTSIEQNPSHIYSKGGQYTVRLTAKNPVGSNSTTKTKYITVESVPVVSFSASPTSGTAPLNVSFTDKSTGYPESWRWDFGDGNTSTEKNPVNVYSSAGQYNVSLTVTNLMGNSTKSISKYIKVS